MAVFEKVATTPQTITTTQATSGRRQPRAILAATTNLLDEALFTVLLPVWSRERLDEATGVGLVSGAVGIGTLTGVVLGAWLGGRLPRYRTFAIGYLIGGAPMFFVLASVSTMPLAIAVSAVSGLFAGFLNPIIYGQAKSGTFTDVKGNPPDAGNVRVDFINGVDTSGGLRYTVRTFNEDSSLQIAKGWDDVTGVGSPNSAWITSVSP